MNYLRFAAGFGFEAMLAASLLTRKPQPKANPHARFVRPLIARMRKVETWKERERRLNARARRVGG